MFYSTLSLVFCLENSRRLGIWFFPKTTSNLLMCRKNATGEGKTKVFLECYCLAESQSGVRKFIRKQELRLLCGFVASLRVLIFAAIGHNITNIPEIFQVLTVFSVAL